MISFTLGLNVNQDSSDEVIAKAVREAILALGDKIPSDIFELGGDVCGEYFVFVDFMGFYNVGLAMEHQPAVA